MVRLKLLHAMPLATVMAFTASYAGAEEFKARLNGFNEIGSIPTTVTVTALGTPAPTTYTGAVLSNGSGFATLDLDRNSGTVAYTLKYKDVGVTPPKTGTVLFAHIHFGKSHASGGILVFFCTNRPFTGTGPTPPSCNTDSSGSGTVSGIWTAENVQAVPGQNVQAGDFDALVDAITSNTAYANIHTTSGTTPDTAFPGGEIRGQIHSGDREDRDDHHDHHR
jgi:hypothetical protein